MPLRRKDHKMDSLEADFHSESGKEQNETEMQIWSRCCKKEYAPMLYYDTMQHFKSFLLSNKIIHPEDNESVENEERKESESEEVCENEESCAWKKNYYFMSYLQKVVRYIRDMERQKYSFVAAHPLLIISYLSLLILFRSLTYLTGGGGGKVQKDQ